MTKARLFIEDKEVELTGEVQFLLNKQFEDISDPTVIINDWSKTVNIPFTANNNKLFGYLYNVDRQIISNPSNPLGIGFDPLKKFRFRLEWDSFILISGYGKMNSISKKIGGGTYNITLNGELGRVFQELSKITMDLNSDSTNYILDTRDYVLFNVNKEIISEAWNNDGQQVENIDDQNISWTDIVGFAPNNAYSTDYDYKSVVLNDSYGNEYILELKDWTFIPSEISNVNIESIIGDGLEPMAIGQFRSYHQLPFVFFNKFVQMFFNKANILTGYNFEFDKTWFNTANPYWYNNVMMLSNMDNDEGSNQAALMNQIINFTGTEVGTVNISFSVQNSPNYYFDDDYLISNNNNIYFKYNPQGYYKFTSYNPHLVIDGLVADMPLGTSISTENIYCVDVIFKDFIGTSLKTVKCGFVNQNPDPSVEALYSQFDYIFKVSGASDAPGQMYGIRNLISLPFDIPLRDFTPSVAYNDINLSLNTYWYDTTKPQLDNGTSPASLRLWNYNSEISIDAFRNYAKSNLLFNINRFWNNDKTPWEIILKYCKMFHIVITVDEVNKIITFTPYYNYFMQNKNNIEDWTNKLDTSHDIIIQPNRPDMGYLKFDYEDTDIELFKKYKDKYGIGYGGLKLKTNNEFNIDEKQFLEGIQTNGIYCASYIPLYSLIYNTLTSVTSSDYLPINKDESKNGVDIFGTFYFYAGKTEWDKHGILNRIYKYLTDDTKIEQLSNVYCCCQNGAGNFVRTDYYTCLDSFIFNATSNGNSLYYTFPSELYFNYVITTDAQGRIVNIVQNTDSIYKTFWENYLNEIYNLQNKQVTAYLRLTPYDYYNFNFNKFIKIQNQIYFINKIIDYDITSNISTKCELITVLNINAYTNTSFIYWGIDPYRMKNLSSLWQGNNFHLKIVGWNHSGHTFTLTSVTLNGTEVGSNWTKTIISLNETSQSIYDVVVSLIPPVPIPILAGTSITLVLTFADNNNETRTCTIVLYNREINDDSFNEDASFSEPD